MSEARPQLGDVVKAATDYLDPVPQVLARHRQPVAAVVAASVLERVPADGERIDVQSLPQQGGKVTLEYDAGESGYADEHGDVLYPPVPGGAWPRHPTGRESRSGTAEATPSPRPCCTSAAASSLATRVRLTLATRGLTAAPTATNPRSDRQRHSNKHADAVLEREVPLSLPLTGCLAGLFVPLPVTSDGR